MADKKAFMTEDIMTEDNFRGLCETVYPLLHKITEEMEKHDVSEMMSISLAKDGYISMSVHKSGWSLCRLTRGRDAKMKHEFLDPVPLAEGK